MGTRLIIVGREEPNLYQTLRDDWAADDNVMVVLDRRVGERRGQTPTAAGQPPPVERRVQSAADVLLAWRGGGAMGRRADVLSALDRSAGAIVVRQKPGAKADSRSTARRADDGRHHSSTRQATVAVPPHAVIAVVILLGTLSGGIFAGLALWLLLSYGFPALSAPTLRSSGSPSPRAASPRSRFRAWLKARGSGVL